MIGLETSRGRETKLHVSLQTSGLTAQRFEPHNVVLQLCVKRFILFSDGKKQDRSSDIEQQPPFGDRK